MKVFFREWTWWFVDSLAWIMSGLRQPESNPPAKLASCSARKSSSYIYRSSLEMDSITLSSGQMIMPEIVRPYNPGA